MSGILLTLPLIQSGRVSQPNPEFVDVGSVPLPACSGGPCLYFLKLEIHAASTPTGIYISSGDLDKHVNQ